MGTDKFYTLRKSDLQSFIDSLARKMPVFAPVLENKDFNFRRLEPGEKINLKGYVNTEFPPRSMFLQEGEIMLEFDKEKMDEHFPRERFAVFGIRPCDVHALLVVDSVMLGHEYVAPHYENLRKNSVIMAMDCTECGENCFCESMGTRDLSDGFDLLFTDQGSCYHVVIGTKLGSALVSRNRLFKRTGKKAKKPKLKQRKKINIQNLPEIMLKMLDSKIWDDVARRCVSCASCTFSCPTCFCYNLIHETEMGKPKKGKVIRELDYCMLLRFSRVAGGLVFREPRRERVKQFFYHKLAYGKINDGMFHCVGCGRCITECMAKIDITEEAEKVRHEYERKK